MSTDENSVLDEAMSAIKEELLIDLVKSIDNYKVIEDQKVELLELRWVRSIPLI